MENILVVGYAYISDAQRATFAYYPYPESLFFLVPEVWKARRGKVVIQGPKEERVYLTKTYFNHSHYPWIGGLLKGWMPAFPIVLLRLKWKRSISLVYSCSEPSLLTTLYNAFWSKLFGLKFIAFSWENMPYERKSHSGIKKKLLRLGLFFCDGLICGTQTCLELHRPYLKKKHAAVFPMNGIDPEQFRSRGNSKIFRDFDFSNKIIFLFIGMIAERKGVHVIVDALPRVLTTLPSVHVVIAGSGEDDAILQQRIEKTDIAGSVTRIPWVAHDEIVKLYSVADVFVYPSLPYRGWEEQFGYALAEASLMGLPIISTCSGSIGDVVQDGTTGILVPPNDRGALSDAMVQLGSSPALRRSMGDAGREFARDNFSHEVVAKKFYDFFRSVIQPL